MLAVFAVFAVCVVCGEGRKTCAVHVWSSRSIVVPINLTSSWRHLVVTSSSSWHRMVVLLSSSLRTVLSSCVILS